ncbi:hypothetical protein BC937DRAFT_86906 [Endogone sp. FLAS-F59071]|nr:hypothetical protein BC937DRAFT_86906 [Endogone sp. FLAS-F59071]|eukprot:RUS19803.1 hypothetical protein BC937DRAFT_86906 [Endogone sp. FLAS-F59071]
MSSPGRSLKEDTKAQPRKGAPGCIATYLFDFGVFPSRLIGQRQELRLEEGGEAAHVSGDWEEGGEKEEDVSQGKFCRGVNCLPRITITAF